MDSNKINKFNEKSELKAFMAKVRSGNLSRLIESNQLQFEENCTYLTQKLKKSEEEIRTKILILQQNSHLIEKFQKQLQELSDQNNDLLGQLQETKEENQSLNAQLQCSEDKFGQLDILYDQEISDLTKRNNELTERNDELKQLLASLESSQEKSIDQFDKTQIDLNDMLAKAEQRNVDILNQLNNLDFQKNKEIQELKKELSDLNEALNQKTVDYEERVQDLQTRLSAALDGNTKVHNLKATVQDLKRKLCADEKEVEDVYLKFKQITHFGASTAPTPASECMYSGAVRKRKQSSSDDPKPLDDSTDSDASTVSIYKSKHRRVLSGKTDEKRKSELPKNKFRAPSFGYKDRPPIVFDQIEIPESPIVSSSVFGNNGLKF